jgi:hypothetical protein
MLLEEKSAQIAVTDEEKLNELECNLLRNEIGSIITDKIASSPKTSKEASRKKLN